MESLATASSEKYFDAESVESLAPYSNAIDAARILLFGLTTRVTRHRHEILNETSPESLHNFRISIRKIRSLLAQLYDVLPEPGLSYQQAAFKRVMKKTGLLRDVEVCNFMIKKQLKKDSSVNQNLDRVQQRLQTFESDLRGKLVTYLESDEFSEFMQQWETYLGNINNPARNLERSKMPIRLVASEAISLRYMNLLKHVKKVLNNKSDIEQIHKLRKSGKKLRYLIDLFSDLYPAKQIKRAIKDLKIFQDCLGSIQDSEVLIHLLGDMPDAINKGLTTEYRNAILQLIEFQNIEKNKYHKKAVKHIQKFYEESTKAMDKLIRI